MHPLPPKLCKKRLARVLKRLFTAHKSLTPEALLEATIPTASNKARILQGLFGVGALGLSLQFFLINSRNEEISLALLALALLLLTGGGLLLYKAIEGRRKKVKEFLVDLADRTLQPQDIITLVEKIFQEVSNQCKSRNTLPNTLESPSRNAAMPHSKPSPFNGIPAESFPPAQTQEPIRLDIPTEEITLSLKDLGGIESMGEAATELASRTIEEVAEGIISGIFDGV